jgi:hypothetical protein
MRLLPARIIDADAFEAGKDQPRRSASTPAGVQRFAGVQLREFLASFLHHRVDLSFAWVFRWIAKAIPKNNRWYPVFERYLQQIADRVEAFGGNPGSILPSPLGDGKLWPPVHPAHPTHPGGKPHHPDHHHGHDRFGEGVDVIGKVSGLVFDRFGDFEGFVLESLHGEHRRFESREKAVELLAHTAWRERLLASVFASHHHPHHATTMVLLTPPAVI